MDPTDEYIVSGPLRRPKVAHRHPDGTVAVMEARIPIMEASIDHPARWRHSFKCDCGAVHDRYENA